MAVMDTVTIMLLVVILGMFLIIVGLGMTIDLYARAYHDLIKRTPPDMRR